MLISTPKPQSALCYGAEMSGSDFEESQRIVSSQVIINLETVVIVILFFLIVHVNHMFWI